MASTARRRRQLQALVRRRHQDINAPTRASRRTPNNSTPKPAKNAPTARVMASGDGLLASMRSMDLRSEDELRPNAMRSGMTTGHKPTTMADSTGIPDARIPDAATSAQLPKINKAARTDEIAKTHAPYRRAIGQAINACTTARTARPTIPSRSVGGLALKSREDRSAV